MIKIVKNDLIYIILAFSLIAGSGIGFSKLYLFHIVGIYGLLIVFVSNYSLNPAFIIKKRYGAFTALILFTIFSLFWTLNKTYTLYQTFYLAVGFSIIILINTYMENKKIFYLFIPVVIGLIIGLFEGLGIGRWPLSPYSDYITYFGRAYKGGALLEPITIPTIFYGNPNDLTLALNYLLCFVLFIRKRILKVFLLFIIFFIIFKTGSRGGQITMLFAIGCYFLFFSKKFRLFCLLTFPIIGTGFYFLVKRIIVRYNIDYLLDFSYAGTQNSIGIRQQLLLNCINYLGENKFNLLFGAGGGASKQIHIIADNTFGIYSTHFFILEILTEYGLIVFALIIIVYLNSLYKTFRLSRPTKAGNKMSGAVFLALLTTLPGSISSSSIIYFFPFWIIIGFTFYYQQNYRSLCENTSAC